MIKQETVLVDRSTEQTESETKLRGLHSSHSGQGSIEELPLVPTGLKR